MPFDVTRSVSADAEHQDVPAYKFLYCGREEGSYTADEAIEVARKDGYKYITWGSESIGYSGIYNGDTWLLYNDPNDLRAGYREDAMKYGKTVEEYAATLKKNIGGYDVMSAEKQQSTAEQKFYLNRVKNELIYSDKGADGKPSGTVRVGLPQLSDENGLIYARVASNKVFPAHTKDGSPMAGYSNVNLGSQQVEILKPSVGDDGKKHYQSTSMDANELAHQFNDARRAAIAERRAAEKNESAVKSDENKVDAQDYRTRLSQAYTNLSAEAAKRMPDELVSDMALAAQEEAEM